VEGCVRGECSPSLPLGQYQVREIDREVEDSSHEREGRVGEEGRKVGESADLNVCYSRKPTPC